VLDNNKPMKNLRSYLPKPLQPKRLSNSTAALAGLASAVSVFVGVLAARAAPHGWFRIASALHLHRQPMIVKLGPLLRVSPSRSRRLPDSSSSIYGASSARKLKL
jgi:hypothetical protein